MSAESRWPGGDEFAELADPYRRELLAHCYRMLGSLHDAEDLVQDTLIRAWRGYENFDGRSSLRTWLYRIATNACLTALRSHHRRVLPSGLGVAVDDPRNADLTRADAVPWLDPIPTARLAEQPDDPATIVAIRDSTRLALVAAFQRLPVRQRAVLLLVEVVGYRPAEAGEFLGIGPVAARSLLQRARSTLADVPPYDQRPDAARVDEAVLNRYLAAFEADDSAAIAELLREDVEYEMPPFPIWFRGRAAVLDHLHRRVFTRSRRSIRTSANGYPAIATYSESADGRFLPHAIHLLETDGESIARIVVFIDRALFPSFGLASSLPAAATP
ncbi:RNA polymerase subunit sigma-70 [Rugosimonospora africana]|uniref:RNA polymerase subunit sigma-70 n=1 Tax=Rugosimonospora africana TaxID=556532 RepID=UPI0019418C58|nr:RNA polymerase subunit sigma-70 [Rugosimonospora africana]